MSTDIQFNKNEDQLKLSLSEMKRRLEKIYLGGGKKAIEKQKERNKLTARERIEYLRDKDRPFIEMAHLPEKACMKNRVVARQAER